MSCVSAETSQKIKNMSIVCALLVVVIHVTWPTESVCLTWFINQLVAQGIARIAVPFFFVVSGFFLAAHFDEEGWWSHETRKRVRSLVVPFFVWNILAYLMLLLQWILVDIIAHRPFSISIVTNGELATMLGLNLRCMPLNAPMWYMRCLFFFMLLSPLFKMGIRRLRIGWIILAFFVAGIPHFFLSGSASFWSGFFYHGAVSLVDIFYFSVGIYLGDSKVRVHSRLLFIVCAVYSFGFLIVRTIVCIYGMKTPSFESLFVSALMYVVWHIMPVRAFPKWLTACSFSVYVLHYIILDPVETVFKKSLLDAQTQSILVCITVIVVSLVVSNLLRKYLPRVSNFLFAGRV